MKAKISWLSLLVLNLAVLVQAPVLAGVVYEIEVTDHKQSPPRAESIEAAVEGKNLKIEIASGGRGAQGEIIFRGDRGELLMIDHDREEVSVMDEESIGHAGDQMRSAASEMRKVLEQMPEEERELVERMMKQNMPTARQSPRLPPSEIRKTGERGTRNGYPCIKMEEWRDGRKTRELWVTELSNVEGGDEVADAFEEVADFFGKVMESMPQGEPGGGPMDDSLFALVNQLDAFPVVVREFGDDGSLESESELRSDTRRELDPEDFEPPKGYDRLRGMSPP